MKKLILFLLIALTVLTLASCDSISDIIATPGVIYDISADGTYAMVIGYKGIATKVRIAAEYQGLPVKNIYLVAFNNKSITSVVIPDSVTSIGGGAFYNCSSLTSINVSDENTTYKSINGNLYSKDGKNLIQYATGKTDSSFIIPDGVVGLGNEAFAHCDSLTSVTIPKSVTSIGDNAFMDCNSLTSVTIPKSVTSIGNWAFSSCSSLTSINVSYKNTTYKSINGNLYSKDGKTLIRYAMGKTDSSFIIPDSVVGLGNYAFDGCDSLTSVTIPDSVESIGFSAFSDCSLTSVTIPNSVTSIDYYAFAGCDSLTSINVGNQNTTYKSINGNLYSNDGKTLIQYATGKTDSSFIIPDSVVGLGNYAFDGCDSLTSVTIPKSVTSIGGWAFADCDSLTSIKYRGTEAEWDAISKGAAWNSWADNCTITCNYTEE